MKKVKTPEQEKEAIDKVLREEFDGFLMYKLQPPGPSWDRGEFVGTWYSFESPKRPIVRRSETNIEILNLLEDLKLNFDKELQKRIDVHVKGGDTCCPDDRTKETISDLKHLVDESGDIEELQKLAELNSNLEQVVCDDFFSHMKNCGVVWEYPEEIREMVKDFLMGNTKFPLTFAKLLIDFSTHVADDVKEANKNL